jgi:hypothetical protein
LETDDASKHWGNGDEAAYQTASLTPGTGQKVSGRIVPSLLWEQHKAAKNVW